MQTGIHFENGQVYSCRIDGQRTIEQEPVRMQGSWMDYMIENITGSRLQDENIGIVMDGMTPEVMEEARKFCRQMGLPAGSLKLYTKEEAVVGLVRFQKNELDRGNTAVFDYTQSGFNYYEVKKRNGQILVRRQDYTSEIAEAAAKTEKDQAFVKIIKKALAKGVTATVYLCGDGFDGQWFQESTRVLCMGRRVFMGKHLYASGAAYLSGEEVFEKNQEDAVILTDTMTMCQIGLTLHHHGRDVFYPLMKEGRPWFESKGEMELFVSDISSLTFELRNKAGIKQAMVCFPLTGIVKNKDVVYQLKVQGKYLAPDRCRLKVLDQGFGSIRSSSLQVWQQDICLERGDFHE